jgi:Leucine Rich repeat
VAQLTGLRALRLVKCVCENFVTPIEGPNGPQVPPAEAMQGLRHTRLHDTLQALPHLTSLTLRACCLDEGAMAAVAPAFVAMTGLAELDVSLNRIDADDSGALGRSLRPLEHLTSLDLSSAAFSPPTPPGAEQDGLEYWPPDMSEVWGINFAAGLGHLDMWRLQKLRLASQGYERLSPFCIASVLHCTLHVTMLSLAGQTLQTCAGRSNLDVLWGALAGLTKLRELDLSGNCLDSLSRGSFRMLRTALGLLFKLEVLCLGDLYLWSRHRFYSQTDGSAGSEEWLCLFEELDRLPSLQKVIFDRVTGGPDGWMAYGVSFAVTAGQGCDRICLMRRQWLVWLATVRPLCSVQYGRQ